MLDNDWQIIAPIFIASVLALLKAIDYSITWNRLQKRIYSQAEFELSHLEKKPDRKSWHIILNVVTLIFTLGVFVYDVLLIRALISTHSNFSWSSWIVIGLIMGALPIFMFVDALIGIVKKQGKKEWLATLQVDGGYSNVFKRCQVILLNMGASLSSLARDSGKISARLRRYEILVKLDANENDTQCSVTFEGQYLFSSIMPHSSDRERKIIEEIVNGFYKLEK